MNFYDSLCKNYIHMKKQLSLLFILLIFSSLCMGQNDKAQFMNLNRIPDGITIQTANSNLQLVYKNMKWQAEGIEVKTSVKKNGLFVVLSSQNIAIKNLYLKWNIQPSNDLLYLGDAWERGYGNLQWLPPDSNRLMPWYFMASNKAMTHGYGVMTSPNAMCSWKITSHEVILRADVRSGGVGVELGNRKLNVCTIVCRKGLSNETPFEATRSFCNQMSPNPRLPKQPVYGFNDWYCDYGNNSAENVLYYAAFVARLAPKGTNRPFMVIDDGWQVTGGGTGHGGPWDNSNAKFPSMEKLATAIKKMDVRPGIWVHLLTAQKDQPASWRMKNRPAILDISKPEVRQYVIRLMKNFTQWGYELIKHDYSTRDISNSWGKSGGAADTATWAFADRSRTTAEIITDHYRSIREGGGNALIIGCNTIGHLAAGIFEISRIGDDTSGNDWGRVLKMGVNSLAFRGPQHDAFFAADADCVGLSKANAIPWSLNRQWLQLVSQSGTPLFISFKKGLVTSEQEQEIATALLDASKKQPLAEPLDWFETIQPAKWKLMGKVVDFNWKKVE
jgi:alpha-galactosidase